MALVGCRSQGILQKLRPDFNNFCSEPDTLYLWVKRSNPCKKARDFELCSPGLAVVSRVVPDHAGFTDFHHTREKDRRAGAQSMHAFEGLTAGGATMSGWSFDGRGLYSLGRRTGFSNRKEEHVGNP